MNASSDDEGNNAENYPETSYDGENMNAYYNNEENNDEVAPDPPTYDEITNAYYDEVTPDTPKNSGNNEIIDNDKEEYNERET